MRVPLTVLGIILVVGIILSKQTIPSILPQEIGVKSIITDPADRQVLADFCLNLADKIQEDGLLPEGERRVTTVYELEDMRKALADEKLFALGKKYPELPKCLGAYLDKIPHEDELTKEGRARWVAAFNSIAQEAMR